MARIPGRVVGILGPDGVGKSTLIKGLMAHLQTRGIQADRHHWRVRWKKNPCIDGPLIANPHQQTVFGLLKSLLKLGYYLITAWPAWWRWVIPARRAGHWVILDRFAEDLVHDAHRYRYGGPKWIARLWASLMPRPDRIIVLIAPVSVILARKQEVTPSHLAALLSSYRSVRGQCYDVIDTEASPAAVLERVLAMLDIDDSMRRPS